MNRFGMDHRKYVFRPPQYSAFWASVFYPVSDLFYRRRIHRVSEVAITGAGAKLKELYDSGAALLLTPNHSDHCDPHVLLRLSRMYSAPLNFMAARETFQKAYGVNGFVLQKMGAFSVDREGADIQAIKQAMSTLQEGKYPLVMFPEGEIYHLNERLTPLNEGAATLALRAAKNIAKSDGSRKACIIPVAMKYSYRDDISATFSGRMARLERQITWEPQDGLDIVERIYKYGRAMLALKEMEYLGRTLDGELTERLEKFREILIGEQEEKYFGKKEDGNHPGRIRKVRGKIRTILLDEKNPPDEQTVKGCEVSQDRLYLAIQLFSYPGQYLTEKPSMGRIAETILKFEEDVLQGTSIVGDRRCEVTVCEPIDLMPLMDRYKEDSKGTVASVTESVESAIRSVLEA